MTETQSSVEVLKVDTVGRVCTPKEKRDEILVAYRKSGMTGRQFAQFCGIKYATLMNWVGKANREASAGRAIGAEGIRWVEASVESSGEALVIEIGGIVKMAVSNSRQAGLAAEVIGTLGLGAKVC
jgi:hypothetical protein